MISSPLYWHPWLYKTGMHLLHRGRFNRRFEIVARWIPPGAEVLDVCCGVAGLEPFVQQKQGRYRGLEWNRMFVDDLGRRGIDARAFDLRRDPLPESDVVVMMGSLYQFAPDADVILRKLYAAAKRRLIVMEAVEHMSDSPNPLIKKIAFFFTNTRSGACDFRFTRESFRRVAEPLEPEILEAHGRDMLAVWIKDGAA